MGDYIVDYYRGYQGDARSLDASSCATSHIKTLAVMECCQGCPGASSKLA